MEHYLVLTDDIDTTRDFYCHVLGLTVGPRPPLEFLGYWLYIGDIPCVHIGEWNSYTLHSNQLGIPVTTRAKGTGGLDHIAFNADDYDEISGRLQKHGVRSALNVVPENGLRQLFLEDPNGIKLEINIPAR
jgi:catechol 2,3-dioxygenase-like lactoylglutathione lyase family enzyme